MVPFWLEPILLELEGGRYIGPLLPMLLAGDAAAVEVLSVEGEEATDRAEIDMDTSTAVVEAAVAADMEEGTDARLGGGGASGGGGIQPQRLVRPLSSLPPRLWVQPTWISHPPFQHFLPRHKVRPLSPRPP